MITWPIVTEACHMLDFSIQAQLNLLEWIKRGGLILLEIKTEDVTRIIHYTKKYKDIPMDLADASLLVVAESYFINKVISIDTDFYIYRNIRNRYLQNTFLQNFK